MWRHLSSTGNKDMSQLILAQEFSPCVSLSPSQTLYRSSSNQTEKKNLIVTEVWSTLPNSINIGALECNGLKACVVFS